MNVNTACANDFAPTQPTITYDWVRLVQENVRRLNTANSAIRHLHALGVRVQMVDVSANRPRLYLQSAPGIELPLRGITRRRIDSEVFECAAILNECELVWTEFEENLTAA